MSSVMTPIGVLYFPAFHTPKVNKQNPGQGARFSGLLLLDEQAVQTTAMTNLKAAIKQAVVDELGAKADDKLFKSLRLPLRKADEKDYGDGWSDGVAFLSAWKKGDEAPGVVDLQGSPILVPGDVFSGQLARFTVRPFYYDNNGNRGVSLYLEHVQIVKADMPRRDGRQSAQAAFANAGQDEQMAALGIVPGSAGASAGASSDFPF